MSITSNNEYSQGLCVHLHACKSFDQFIIFKFGQNLKRSKISKTGEGTSTKIGLHAFHMDLYLHEFFEPIQFFDPHGL